MSFNHHARKVRDPRCDIWLRWSNIHSCLHFIAHGAAFGRRREELFSSWKVGPDNPPRSEKLLEAMNRIEAERNQRLEQMRAYERRRIREKMRGKRRP